MKKLLFLAITLCMAMGAYAQAIKVENGSLDFLKSEQSINVLFTYNNMRVGKMAEADYVAKKTTEYNKKEAGRGDSWAKAWVSDRESRFEPHFIELFNKYMSEKHGATIGGESRYLLTINTDFSEPGFNVGVARQNALVNLTCVFTSETTGEEVATITITNASANSFWGMDFDTGYRLQESYAKAGRELAKFIIKKLKLK